MFDGYVSRQGSGFGPNFGEASRSNRDQLSVAMWVQFDRPGDTGIYFTLYSVDSELKATNKRVMMQANGAGVWVDLFGPDDLDRQEAFLEFPEYLNITSGKWHHVAVTWSGVTGTLTLIADGVIGAKRENFGLDKVLPQHGYVTLGSSIDPEDSGRTRTESGFKGKLTRVQVWNRELSIAQEIQNQVSERRAAPLLFEGLILRWSGYDRTVGGVERLMPSVSGESSSCRGENCETDADDKEPPRIEYCNRGIGIKKQVQFELIVKGLNYVAATIIPFH